MTTTSKHRLLRWVPEIAVLVTWSLTVIGAVWAASAERADVRHELREQKSALADHEARLRVLEKQTGEIAADVRWIRQTLEKQRP
jgi:hypothetical protein